MASAKLLYYKGQWLPSTALPLPPHSPGLAHGWGVFETLRFREGRPCFLNAHLERMSHSCQQLGLSIDANPATWWNLSLSLLQKNQAQEGLLKWMVWREEDGQTGLSLFIREQGERPSGLQSLCVCVADACVSSKAITTQHKTLSYLDNLMARKHAKEQGFDEAILQNERGEVCECTMSNLFLRRGKEIITPALSSGLLPGVIRRVLIELIRSELQEQWQLLERTVSWDELLGADELWVTNANWLLASVSQLSMPDGNKRKYPTLHAPLLYEHLLLQEKLSLK